MFNKDRCYIYNKAYANEFIKEEQKVVDKNKELKICSFLLARIFKFKNFYKQPQINYGT